MHRPTQSVSRASSCEGIFLCRRQDIQWFYQDGAGRIHPELWQQYVKVIPEDERDDMVSAYYRRLTSEDPAVRSEAARAWSLWEGSTSNLKPKDSVIEHFSDEATALSLARIECHYFMHDSFLRENQLLENAYKLRDIPGVIVHGRYDMVCPIEQAWALHRAWPEGRVCHLSYPRAIRPLNLRSSMRWCVPYISSRRPEPHGL